MMAELAKRQLGRTGLLVTELGFGASELRGGKMWGPDIPDSQAGDILNSVLDAGINFIDTALDYGRSEELIGTFISHRRSEYFLASKCGCIPGEMDNVPHLFNAANVRAGVEHSLRTLNTDYIDLVQFHHSLNQTELEAEGALEELLKIRDEGKTRFVGMSGALPKIAELLDWGVFDAYQIPYSAVEREHEEVMAKAAGNGAVVIVRGGVARGGPSDWSLERPYDWSFSQRAKNGAIWEQAGIDELLDGMSRMEFVLRFTLSNPGLSTAIVGTSNLDHLRENVVAAAKGPLPDDVVRAAKERLARAGSEPTSI